MSYKRDLADALLLLGFLAPEKNYYGGYNTYDFDIYEHANLKPKSAYYPPSLGGINPVCGKWERLHGVEEDYHYVFDGTDCDSGKEYIVEALISCKCGYITDLKLFYNGTMADLLQQVLSNSDNWLE